MVCSSEVWTKFPNLMLTIHIYLPDKHIHLNTMTMFILNKGLYGRTMLETSLTLAYLGRELEHQPQITYSSQMFLYLGCLADHDWTLITNCLHYGTLVCRHTSTVVTYMVLAVVVGQKSQTLTDMNSGWNIWSVITQRSWVSFHHCHCQHFFNIETAYPAKIMNLWQCWMRTGLNNKSLCFHAANITFSGIKCFAFYL
jgi:hypothetical protein